MIVCVIASSDFNTQYWCCCLQCGVIVHAVAHAVVEVVVELVVEIALLLLLN